MYNPTNPADRLCRLHRRFTEYCAALALMVLASVAVPSHAMIGAVDDVPAATLLYPYFEVDLDNPTGTTTLISITNTSATAVLAHLTIWSDLGVPTLTFDNYLTGYDVQSINLRDILVNGIFPQDASAGQDPSDTNSPKGQFSQDINFASCFNNLPKKPLPPTWMPPNTTAPYLESVESLQKELTGKASTRQTSIDPASRINCVAHDYGDRIARGYITIDTVNSCGSLTPADGAQYMAFNNGRITYQNVLVGDYMIVNPGTNQLQVASAAHVEAASDSTLGFTAGGSTDTFYGALPVGSYTFYGRYVNWVADVDVREPMATNWAGMGALGQTDAMVWRDTKTVYTLSTSFNCPAVPGPAPTAVPWQPLGSEQLLAFDVQEGAAAPIGQFAYATGRYGLGSPSMAIPLTSKLGWIFADLNAPIAGVTNPPADPAALQAFVTFARRPEGSAFSGSSGSVGYTLDSGTAPNHTPIN